MLHKDILTKHTNIQHEKYTTTMCNALSLAMGCIHFSDIAYLYRIT